ncbi:MAG: SH3 domain-containing protein [Chloroflexi bacterium]|nr:SH3 domain-containing protein [Chloroflexota bacterium]
MIGKRFTSLIVVSTFILSACRFPSTPIPATNSVLATAGAPGSQATTQGKSAMPSGGDVITTTDELTPTTDITATNGVTVTGSVSTTVELTPTNKAPAGNAPQSDIPANQTDVKSVTTHGAINLRSGPGVRYRIVGFVTRNKTLQVTGVSVDNKWWRVDCATTRTNVCWVIAGTRYVTANQ